MDGTIFNSTMATNVTLTQAQIVTTAVIGSILMTLVVLNIVLYSIYKKLMQDPKPTIKLGKQESIQLYQMKSTMEYNTLSNSSMNQSQNRTLESTSYSGEETMSVNISSADVTKSFSNDRSMCSNSVNESLALETSLELQVSTSMNIKSWEERKQSLNKLVKESANERIEQESTDSLEIEAQIHDNSLQNTNKPQRLSDIHLYNCIKSQMAQNEIQRSITHKKQSKPLPGIDREMPLGENCLRKQSTIKQNEKKYNYLSQKSEIHQNLVVADNPEDKSLRLQHADSENITEGLSESLSRHKKPPRNSRKHVHSNCSKESHNPPNTKEQDHSKPLKGSDHPTNSRERNYSTSRKHSHLVQSSEYSQTSREQVKSKCLKENLHSRGSKEHVHSKLSRDHTRPHSFRIQNEIKGYVDMTDFENDSDTEASVLAALDSVQTYQGVQLLTSGEGLMGCPVVEFQNKAFEFSETKTSLEEVDDTDL